ncbi:MAG: ATP-binding protein, partial [Chloroflexia bacterium]|nr:ATP-binding protein [Chloroflexia bacterium]
VPSWLVSDGTLRLLALTLLAYLPQQEGIYLIEEPENGIHPKALEGVYQSLSSVYCSQILVATHSPLFLGLAEPAQLLCFARNPSGAVAIVTGDHHPALQNWQGEVDLSAMYAAGVLG